MLQIFCDDLYKAEFDDIVEKANKRAEEREAEATVQIDAAKEALENAEREQKVASELHAKATEEINKINESREQLLKEQETVASALETAERERTKALDEQRMAQEAKEKSDAAIAQADAKMAEALAMMERMRSTTPVVQPVVRPLEDHRLGVSIATNNGDGVLITNVTNNSAAHRAGLQSNDVIHRFDDKPLTSLQDYSNAVDTSGERIRLHVLKADGTRRIIPFVFESQE